MTATTTTKESVPAPIVTTDKCLIRPYMTADAQALADAANHPEIVAYMRNTFPHPYTLESSNFWINLALSADPMVNFALCTPEGIPAGGVGLKPHEDVECRTFELGYWIAMDHWGKGIATTAVKAFSAWAFKQFPELVRMEANVFEGNDASMKVLEKAGYTKEGIRRKAIYKHGKVLDLAIYSLLREEVGGLS